MLKKIYQADFLLLPDQEFWNMYILLRNDTWDPSHPADRLLRGS